MKPPPFFDMLKTFHQEHLVTFWDELKDSEQKHLAAQIHSIDFAQIADLYKRRHEPVPSLNFADQIGDPLGYKFSTVTNPSPLEALKPISVAEAVEAGTELLQANKVAFVLVAGGQGTRLGFPHPKGMYPIGPVSHASLFQIHFEKVFAISRRFGYRVPYCIMTSPATHSETIDYLKSKNYFGLHEEDVFIFCQGTMPPVSIENGQVLLDSKGSIALSPDGHGGMLAAVTKCMLPEGLPSLLTQLRQRGIEYLFYHQVDNPLVRIGSTEFLGYHVLSGSELTSQVIRKQFPAEKVGNIVEADGKLHMIEYIDLKESFGKQTKPDGSLKIWAGSIAVHIFNTEMLERVSSDAVSMPFHYARKKVPYIDPSTGKQIVPATENAFKWERFIFDLLPLANNAVVVEVDSPNHYSPLKNAPCSSTNSPEIVKHDLSAMHASWLRQAGATVKENVMIEISPLFADSAEATAEKMAEHHEKRIFDQSAYLTER